MSVKESLEPKVNELRRKAIRAIGEASDIRDRSTPNSFNVKTPLVLPAGHKSTFQALKNAEHCKHLAEQAISLVANLNDYIRELAANYGADKGIVKSHLRDSPDLQICLDINIALKHIQVTHRNKLEKDRIGYSGRRPQIRDASLCVPVSRSFADGVAIYQPGKTEKDPLRGYWIQLATRDPGSVRLSVPVADEEGNEIGDAIEIARRGLDQWDELLKQLDFPFEDF